MNQRRSDSPIKKQLAKKLVTYFDQLDEAKSRERALERKNSRSRSFSKSKSTSQMPIGKSSVEESELYDDIDIRRQKLSDLKELMRKELLAAKIAGITEPRPEDIAKSLQGYPTFMKSGKMNESYRRKLTEDVNIAEFKKSVHRLLESRVKKDQMGNPNDDGSSVDTELLEQEVEIDFANKSQDPASHSKLHISSNIFDEHLYPLETKKKVLPTNHVESSAFDFHQRKSKEIRRLQYASENQRVPRQMRSASKEIIEVQKLQAKHQEEVDVVPTTYAGKARERRTHPDEGYPVWIRFQDGNQRTVIAAMLKNVEGFKINPETDTMEVIEKDRVTVNPRDGAGKTEGFKVISGRVERPNEGKFENEDDCELVVQDKAGKRYPILFYERNYETEMVPEPEPEPKRVMHDANCRAFDLIGKFLGRGRLELSETDKATGRKIRYAKGILVNSDEKIEFVLAKFIEDGRTTLKHKSLKHTHHDIEEEEDMEISGYDVKCLTLAEQKKGGNPELLFILNSEYVPQKDMVLSEEQASYELEDYRKFEGDLLYEEAPGDREGTLWLILSKAKEVMDARTKVKSPAGMDKIRIELDEADDSQDITNILDRIKWILERRKRAAEDLVREKGEIEEAERIERERLETERLELEEHARRERVRLDRERLDRERLDRERKALEEAEKIERERRERLEKEEAQRKLIEKRQLNKSQTYTESGSRGSVIHGGRKPVRAEQNKQFAGHMDFIVHCPGGCKLHVFVAPNGKGQEVDQQVDFQYYPIESSTENSEQMKVTYNGKEYHPNGIRRPKSDAPHSQADPKSDPEVRVVQPRDDQYEREKRQREEERQRQITEDHERLQSLKDEQERLAIQRWQEEQRLERIKREADERQIRIDAEEAERRIILEEEEAKLKDLREAEDEERQIRLNEEEERLRQLRAEHEIELVRIRNEKNAKERERLRLEDEERQRKIIEEEERIRRLEEEQQRQLHIQEEEERVKRLRDSIERRRRIEDEERERRRLEEEERQLRIRHEEEERMRRLIEEEEERDRKRLEDEERLRREEEDKRRQLEEEKRQFEEDKLRESQERRQRLADEENERRLRQEAEEAERRLREEIAKKQKDDGAQRKLAQEAEEAERRLREEVARRQNQEEEQRLRYAAEEDERLRLEREREEEKRRQDEEIQTTQKKVRELKAALERSKIENSQDIIVIKKSHEVITNNRYRDSVDSEAASKKDVKVSSEEQEKPKQAEQKPKPVEKPKTSGDPRQRFSMIQHRVSPTIETAKRKSTASKSKKPIVKKEEHIKEEPKTEPALVQEEKAKSHKESSGKKSDSIQNSQYREDRSRVQSIKIQEINHSQMEVAHEGERYTKIELNLENSEDDIDFIGYGTIRVSNKKDSSRSLSEIKQSFTRISPARDLAATIKGDDRNMTTRPFTPITSEKKAAKQIITTSTVTESHITGHQSSSRMHSKIGHKQIEQQDDREEEVIFT